MGYVEIACIVAVVGFLAFVYLRSRKKTQGNPSSGKGQWPAGKYDSDNRE
jgi:hypothetical protein